MGPNARIVGGGLMFILLSTTPASNQAPTPQTLAQIPQPSATTTILRPAPALQGLQYTEERNNVTYAVSVNNIEVDASFGGLIHGDLGLERLVDGTGGQKRIKEFVIRGMQLNQYNFDAFYHDLNLHLLEDYGNTISAEGAEALFRRVFSTYSALDGRYNELR